MFEGALHPLLIVLRAPAMRLSMCPAALGGMRVPYRHTTGVDPVIILYRYWSGIYHFFYSFEKWYGIGKSGIGIGF